MPKIFSRRGVDMDDIRGRIQQYEQGNRDEQKTKSTNCP
jgi:hypothetical protein